MDLDTQHAIQALERRLDVQYMALNILCNLITEELALSNPSVRATMHTTLNNAQATVSSNVVANEAIELIRDMLG